MRKVEKADDGVYLFYCIGCECHHGIWVDAPNPVTGGVWQFNGNHDSPSFIPSLNIGYSDYDNKVRRRCHSVITDGNIYYCGDCTHKYADSTHKLPDIEEIGERDNRQ